MDLNLQIFINYLSVSNMILNHNVNCYAIFIFLIQIQVLPVMHEAIEAQTTKKISMIYYF